MDILEPSLTLLDEGLFLFAYNGAFLYILDTLAPEIYRMLGSVGVT